MGAARQPGWEEEQTEAEREEKAEEDEDNVRQGELRRKRDDDKMIDLLEQGQRQPEVQRHSETESYAAQQTTEEVAAGQDATGPSQEHPTFLTQARGNRSQISHFSFCTCGVRTTRLCISYTRCTARLCKPAQTDFEA